MNIMNTGMPEAARQAKERAHQQRGKAGTHNRKRQHTSKQDYLDFLDYRRNEQEYREQHKGKHRDEVRALAAKTFLHTQHKPKLTARRLQIAQVKEAASRASIAKARDPQRVRAAMQRELNTACYVILKQRGFK